MFKSIASELHIYFSIHYLCVFICEIIWRWTDLKTLWKNCQIPLVHHKENEYNESKRKKNLIYKVNSYLLLVKLSSEKCHENQVSLSLVYLYIVWYCQILIGNSLIVFLYSSWREKKRESFQETSLKVNHSLILFIVLKNIKIICY